jgi:hypothetical protein
MSNRLASVLTLAVLASAASTAHAQSGHAQSEPAKPAAPTPVAPVTVEAAPPPKVIRQQSHAFTESFAVTPNTERNQLSRWRDPVCVLVRGLAADQSALIKTRIEDVAKALDLGVAKPGCIADIEIIFSARPQDLMDVIAKKSEELLGYYHRHDHDRLKTVSRPIQAWYITAVRSGPYWIMADPENMTGGCGTRDFNCPESKYANALVVADAKALEGQDVGMLSDYLAVVALGPPRSLDGCLTPPSVIDALSKAPCPHDKPDGLTAADAAYLTALYKADLEYKTNLAETDISRRMADILVKAAGDKK